MGDKARAKALAREAGVPVVPGVEGEDVSLEEVRAFASEHGYPVVIKAVAGGGGKGMRAVREAGELEAALDAARREGKAAFGDARVLVERYLERPRHIEIQVLADAHGARRAPRRARVLAAAPPPEGDRGGALAGRRRRAARAHGRGGGRAGARVRLRGRGDGRVHRPGRRVGVLLPRDEHAAAGRAPGDRARLRRRPRRAAAARRGGRAAGARRRRRCVPRGHAVEARLYAEDPANGFLPAVGTVRRYVEPAGRADGLRHPRGQRRRHGLRPDAREGDRPRARTARPRCGGWRARSASCSCSA